MLIDGFKDGGIVEGPAGSGPLNLEQLLAVCEEKRSAMDAAAAASLGTSFLLGTIDPAEKIGTFLEEQQKFAYQMRAEQQEAFAQMRASALGSFTGLDAGLGSFRSALDGINAQVAASGIWLADTLRTTTSSLLAPLGTPLWADMKSNLPTFAAKMAESLAETKVGFSSFSETLKAQTDSLVGMKWPPMEEARGAMAGLDAGLDSIRSIVADWAEWKPERFEILNLPLWADFNTRSAAIEEEMMRTPQAVRVVRRAIRRVPREYWPRLWKMTPADLIRAVEEIRKQMRETARSAWTPALAIYEIVSNLVACLVPWIKGDHAPPGPLAHVLEVVAPHAPPAGNRFAPFTPAPAWGWIV